MTEHSQNPNDYSEPARESMAMPPWEDRGRFGLLNALYLTIRKILLSPGDFFSRMPTSVGISQPLFFAIVVGVMTSFFSWLWTMTGSPLLTMGNDLPFGSLPVFSAMQFVFSPVIALFAVFITAGLAHFGMILFAGNRFGFEATLRVVAYSQAVWLVILVPVCGSFVAIFWWPAVLIIGLARIHDVDPWRSVMAVLLPLFFHLVTCGGLVILLTLLSDI